MTHDRQNPRTRTKHQNAAERTGKAATARGHHSLAVVAATIVVAIPPGASIPSRLFVPHDFSLILLLFFLKMRMYLVMKGDPIPWFHHFFII